MVVEVLILSMTLIGAAVVILRNPPGQPDSFTQLACSAQGAALALGRLHQAVKRAESAVEEATERRRRDLKADLLLQRSAMLTEQVEMTVTLNPFIGEEGRA